MGELRLHAIAITEIRDMFGASPELAARLRGIASETFSVPAAENRPRPSLLSRIGPFRRHDPDWTVHLPLATPGPNDWEAIIGGRFVAPERTDASWRALDAWIDALDFDTLTVAMDGPDVDALDFELTKAGLPSRFSLRHLMKDDPALGLRPGQDMRVGYSRFDHVLATADALAPVVDDVDPAHRENAQTLLRFLQRFPAHADSAAAQHRPLPDLFVAWWQDRTGSQLTPA